MPRAITALRYVLSLPERAVRAAVGTVAGMLHESAELLLPRIVRRSRFYEATARNALRIAVELVGGVEGVTRREGDPPAPELAMRKTAGNVIEAGSIAAFGFSPIWLLAGAADVLRGSRVYLETLILELEAARVVPQGTRAGSVAELLTVLEGLSGKAASLVDVPPLELAGLRRSLQELRDDARRLPSLEELARTLAGLRRTAEAESMSLLDTSAAVGLAFLATARRAGRAHLLDPYREDWRPVAREGLAAYARRMSEPYRRAIGSHFDPRRESITERALRRASPGRRGG